MFKLRKEKKREKKRKEREKENCLAKEVWGLPGDRNKAGMEKNRSVEKLWLILKSLFPQLLATLRPKLIQTPKGSFATKKKRGRRENEEEIRK